MNEIEILAKTLETVGIAGFIVISTAVLIHKGLGVYAKRAEQTTLLESKSLDNARAERETSYKTHYELTHAVKHLADKTESVGKSQEEITRIIAEIKRDNLSAIDATKTAETNVLTALNNAYEKHAQEIEKLGRLIGELYTISKERATPDDVRNTINEILPLIESALSKVETRVVSELTKIKLTDSGRFTLATIQQATATPDSFDIGKQVNTTGDTP